MSATTKPRAQRAAQPPAEAAPNSPTVAVASGKATFFSTKAIQEACIQLCHAIALVDVLATHCASAACWAASRLLDLAALSASKAPWSHSVEDLHEASVILAEALAVLGLQAEDASAAEQLTLGAKGIRTMVASIKRDIDAIAGRMA